jgi:hypothetical protein
VCRAGLAKAPATGASVFPETTASGSRRRGREESLRAWPRRAIGSNTGFSSLVRARPSGGGEGRAGPGRRARAGTPLEQRHEPCHCIAASAAPCTLPMLETPRQATQPICGVRWTCRRAVQAARHEPRPGREHSKTPRQMRWPMTGAAKAGVGRSAHSGWTTTRHAPEPEPTQVGPTRTFSPARVRRSSRAPADSAPCAGNCARGPRCARPETCCHRCG